MDWAGWGSWSVLGVVGVRACVLSPMSAVDLLVDEQVE